MSKYRVMVVGMGKRGGHHAGEFHANDRFDLVGICDIDQARLEAAAPKLGNPAIGTDAAAMAAELKPDVFCFCTLPNLRAPMIEIGIDCGAKLIAFEKPIALSSSEALDVKRMIDKSGVKAVVSHQHRYGPHYKKVKELIDAGKIGRVTGVYATATGWAAHMLTHMIDYSRWYNGNAKAEWVVAQAAGRGKFDDIHSSPDYVAGIVHYANGIHGVLEVGCGAPDVPEVGKWWRKNRLGAQGTRGFAECMTDGGWRAVTADDGYAEGPGKMDYAQDMPPYIDEMADWLDDDAAVHQCAFAEAYAGFEIMAAMYRSVLDGGQVALPLTDGRDELAELIAKLPDKAPIWSFPGMAEEF